MAIIKNYNLKLDELYIAMHVTCLMNIINVMNLATGQFSWLASI